MNTEAPGSAAEAEAFGTAARTVDVAALPDGSGNDRDDDEADDERFDAG
ncbi:hypothetical protein [Sinomonas sp. ASV322]|nr:hypothetical protein [Sinomonas sp. ASV322]MDQ4500726.1 hypothetical protein [Sinomonas sp. ASV322]